MNASLLAAHFDRISDAPDALRRLRGLILDLAVRGKLVDQNLNDEPATTLLKMIEAKKAQFAGSGSQTKRSIELLNGRDMPFEVPGTWAWVRLGDLCSKTGSGSTPRGGKSVYQRDGVPFLRSQNIYDDGLRLDDVAYIAHQIHEKMAGTAVLAGDLLLNITGGSIGRCCLVQSGLGQANVSQHVAIIRPAIDGIQGYLHRLVLSPYFQSFVITEQTGAGRGGLPKNRMDRIPVALPPLAEQDRILAKVDELMVMCDRLDVARAQREARRDRLTAASLARLSTPDPDPSRFAGHAHFVLNNLTAITTRPDQVKDLRDTILNLAVHGRLVPHDPNDEPASQLISEIDKNRRRLYAAKKIPKPTSLPSINESDLPFPTPAGWSWTMLGDLCYQVSDGPHFSPQYVGPEEGVPFLSTRNVRPEGFDLSSVKYVSHNDHAAFCKRIRPEKGDIIYTKGGTTGIVKVNDLDFEFSVWVHLAVLRIDKERLVPRYVELVLNSPHCYAQSQHYTQGISNFDLGLTRMVKITIPLPPFQEQRRIVAKVDQVMGLCYRLEAQLATAQSERCRLLDAILYDALNDNKGVADTKEVPNG